MKGHCLPLLSDREGLVTLHFEQTGHPGCALCVDFSFKPELRGFSSSSSRARGRTKTKNSNKKKSVLFAERRTLASNFFFSHFGLRLGLGLSRGALPREHTFFLKLECGNHTYPHLIRTHPSFQSSSSPSSLSPSLVYPPADTIEVLSHPPLTALRHVPPYAGTLSQARRVITASSFADIPSASLFSSTHSQVLS